MAQRIEHLTCTWVTGVQSLTTEPRVTKGKNNNNNQTNKPPTSKKKNPKPQTKKLQTNSNYPKNSKQTTKANASVQGISRGEKGWEHKKIQEGGVVVSPRSRNKTRAREKGCQFCPIAAGWRTLE